MKKKLWLIVAIFFIMAIISFGWFLRWKNKSPFPKELKEKTKEIRNKGGNISIPLEKPPFLK